MSRYASMSSDELVDLAARCLLDKVRAQWDMAAASDTFTDVADELSSRGIGSGDVAERQFRQWLDDELMQRWHQQDLEAHTQMREFLRELGWGDHRREGGALEW